MKQIQNTEYYHKRYSNGKSVRKSSWKELNEFAPHAVQLPLGYVHKNNQQNISIEKQTCVTNKRSLSSECCYVRSYQLFLMRRTTENQNCYTNIIIFA